MTQEEASRKDFSKSKNAQCSGAAELTSSRLSCSESRKGSSLEKQSPIKCNTKGMFIENLLLLATGDSPHFWLEHSPSMALINQGPGKKKGHDEPVK